jgi:hypothetical protein
MGKFFIYAVCVAALSVTAGFAADMSVRGGVTFATPMGDTYSALKQTVGAQGDVVFENHTFGKNYFNYLISANYHPFGLRNANVSQYSMRQFGVFAGAQLVAKTLLLDSDLLLGMQVGAVHDWLVLANAPAGSQQNAMTSIAFRVAPGWDIPVVSNFGVVLEMPWTYIAAARPFGVLSGTFGIRWKL